MRFVKKIVMVAGLLSVAILALGRFGATVTAPAVRPVIPVSQTPARADLAEAVLGMIVSRAVESGLPQPVTLCEACAAAHLGLPAEAVQARCERACGLR